MCSPRNWRSPSPTLGWLTGATFLLSSLDPQMTSMSCLPWPKCAHPEGLLSLAANCTDCDNVSKLLKDPRGLSCVARLGNHCSVTTCQPEVDCSPPQGRNTTLLGMSDKWLMLTLDYNHSSTCPMQQSHSNDSWVQLHRKVTTCH
jgi:hypothetical protein